MKKKIDDYHIHEALDRTFIAMEMFSYVSEHPAVKANKDWLKKAEDAHSIMYELYQMIGAEHLK